MAEESSLADQVKTLQGYMGKFAKAIKDLGERVKVIEKNEQKMRTKISRKLWKPKGLLMKCWYLIQMP
jgi:hypothetical protein